MKKKGLFTVLGMVLALALLASPVWALNIDDHVTIAPNLEGDVLIYPLYIAADGLQTDFEVINTSDVYSTVVKIVLRSHQYSQEVLDFLIYLSPNDVFDATIFYSNGKYMLTSSDESLCLTGGICASAASPMTFALTPPCDGKADSEAFGYIVAIEAWASDSVDPDPLDPGTVNPVDIQKAYVIGIKGDAPEECDTQDIITGNAKLDFVGFDISGYEADTLKNYRNFEDIDVGNETILGKNANSNLCEIEAALSKDELAVPYFDSLNAASLLIATFPTKLASCPASDGTYTAIGPFFDYDKNLNPQYWASFYDLEEHSITEGCAVSPCEPRKDVFPDETNIVLLSSHYDKGWARFSFGSETATTTTSCKDKSGSQGSIDNLKYTGGPVLGLIAHFTSDGFMFARPAYNWGVVNFWDPTAGAGAGDWSDDLLEGEYQLYPGAGGGAYRVCTPPTSS